MDGGRVGIVVVVVDDNDDDDDDDDRPNDADYDDDADDDDDDDDDGHDDDDDDEDGHDEDDDGHNDGDDDRPITSIFQSGPIPGRLAPCTLPSHAIHFTLQEAAISPPRPARTFTLPSLAIPFTP